MTILVNDTARNAYFPGRTFKTPTLGSSAPATLIGPDGVNSLVTHPTVLRLVYSSSGTFVAVYIKPVGTALNADMQTVATRGFIAHRLAPTKMLIPANSEVQVASITTGFTYLVYYSWGPH